MTIFDWQSAASVKRIQDTNFVADFVDDFFTKYNEYQGLVLAPNYYNTGLCLLKSLDSAVRIPGALSNSDTTFGIGNSTSKFPRNDSFIYGGQGMISGCRSNYKNSGYQNVLLDYMPRMYVELTSLPEFIANTLTPLGVTHHYTDTFLYNAYELRHSGRLMYDTTELLPNRDELFVLTKYVIYTNKTNGEAQTALAEYNWNTSAGSSALIWYDTYLPFNCYSNNANYGVPAGDIFYYPYMRNFRAQKIERIDTVDYSYLIGGVPDVHDNIRRVTSTGNGDITPNPWLSEAAGTADRNTWMLSSRPNAPIYTYIAADKRTWKKILTGSGMMWSTVLDDVTKPDDGDLVKPTEPGQPHNPYHDDDGDGDNISDDIPLPDVTFNLNNNAYNRYWIKSSDLVSLQNWIFSDTFLNGIKRLWNDPAEYLINLSLYPFNGYMHDVNNVSSNTISIGNLTSDITAYQMGDGYSAKFNGGSFKLTEYYGSYLDYAPYTSAEIYIPYIGYKPLNINDIMGKTIDLIYVVDWDTNMLTATLLVDNRPLTMYSGSFGVKLAISGTNANQVSETIARGAVSIISNVGMTVANAATGNIPGAIGRGISTVGGAMGTALDVQISPRQFGTPTPLTGLYNTQVPHVIIHRPIAAEPIDFKAQQGYSSSYSAPVSSFDGYLQCSSVNINSGDTMSETEQNEIISLLKGGIYI